MLTTRRAKVLGEKQGFRYWVRPRSALTVPVDWLRPARSVVRATRAGSHAKGGCAPTPVVKKDFGSPVGVI
jgi:hypothetical protein